MAEHEATARRRMVSRHQVRDSLQRMILAGERPPGTKLVQQQLAKRFGVAQGVVREALLELQAFGLVETIDNRGIFVSELDTPKLLQAYEVREVLEGLAARHCCQRASRADIRELYATVERIYSLGVEGKLEERGLLDRQFHHKTVLIAQNQILTRLTEAYYVLHGSGVVRDDHLDQVTPLGRLNRIDAFDLATHRRELT